jgi:hemoglobin-like flavoprotein
MLPNATIPRPAPAVAREGNEPGRASTRKIRMDERKLALLEKSWELVEPRGPEIARRFYDRLFHLDPKIEDLFVLAEMDFQGSKFMAMLGEILRLVRDPERFEATLRQSGRRHEGYGVVGRHYRTVGEALLWAMEAVLPDGFDTDTRRAWAEAYTRMAFLMQKGVGSDTARPEEVR